MGKRPAPIALEDVAGGPPPGTALTDFAQLADGSSEEIIFTEGDLRFSCFLHRHGEEVVAYKNSCPHVRLPLNYRPGKFMDLERKHLFCANHSARFDIKSGKCVSGPCKGAYLTPVAVAVRNGTVFSI